MYSRSAALASSNKLELVPVPPLLEQLVQPPRQPVVTLQQRDRTAFIYEGRVARELLENISHSLHQVERLLRICQADQSQSLLQRRNIKDLWSRLQQLYNIDRTLDSIECPSKCIEQISNPDYLQCLLDAHFILTMSSSLTGHGFLLDQRLRTITHAVTDHFRNIIRGALNDILGSGLRACYQWRVDTKDASSGAADGLSLLLSSLSATDSVSVPVYWSSPLFYSSLYNELVPICESFVSLASTFSDEILSSLRGGNSELLAMFIQIIKAFTTKSERIFCFSISAELLEKQDGEYYMLLSAISKADTYLQQRLEAVHKKERLPVISKLFRRAQSTPAQLHIEYTCLNFGSAKLYLPPYTEVRPALCPDIQAAQHWHVVGISQLFADFYVLCLSSIFDSFSRKEQLSAINLINVYTGSNPLNKQTTLFTNIVIAYYKAISASN